MGKGFYKDGRLHLYVSFHYEPSKRRRDQWEESFLFASRLLFEASQGQMRLGPVYFATESAGSSGVDAWLHEERGSSQSNIDGLGKPNLNMELRHDERRKPYVILHELGHYAFGLHDEYYGPQPVVRACTNDAASGACIMEFAYDKGDRWRWWGLGWRFVRGDVRRFCLPGEHDSQHINNQQRFNGADCWSFLAGQQKYQDLSVPAANADPVDPSGVELEWIRLNNTPRYALVLDRSANMAGAGMDGARFGALYFLTYLLRVDDLLTAVVYDDDPEVVLPLLRPSAAPDFGSALQRIATLTAGGGADAGAALRTAKGQILSATDRAATQAALWFTDGRHTTGTPPEQAIGSLVESGVQVYAISYGPNADWDRIARIAQGTGGRSWHLDATGSGSDAYRIAQKLIEYVSELRDGSGQVASSSDVLPEPPADEPGLPDADHSSLTATDSAAVVVPPSPGPCRRKAYFETGSSRATFVLVHGLGADVEFEVRDPDGQPLAQRPERVHPAAPIMFHVVDQPAVGEWEMRVSRGQRRGDLPFAMFAFSDNKKVSIGLDGDRRTYAPGEKVGLSVQVSHTGVLTGLPPPIVRSIESESTGRQREPCVIHLAEQDRGTGLYQGKLPALADPGTYAFELSVENDGTAFPATRDWVSEHVTSRKLAPRFRREQRFQVRVVR